MENRKFLEFILRRFTWTILTFVIIATLIFFLFRQIGDPSVIFYTPQMGLDATAKIKAAFGLDKPLYIQYFNYLKNVFSLNFGLSFAFLEPAAPVVFDSLVNSLVLMIPSLFIAYTSGILIGVILTWRSGIKESIMMVFALVLRSTPVFWSGLILMSLFGVTLRFFPIGGMASIGASYSNKLQLFLSWEFLSHAVLPTLSMTFYFMGMPLLLMRTSMLEVMHDDFVELCKAKGLKEIDLMYKHVARNAILPVVTLAAVAITWAFGGNVLIENVFSWPGIGKLMVASVLKNDYPVAQFSFLIMAAMALIMNFFADLLYCILDPRVMIDQ